MTRFVEENSFPKPERFSVLKAWLEAPVVGVSASGSGFLQLSLASFLLARPAGAMTFVHARLRFVFGDQETRIVFFLIS